MSLAKLFHHSTLVSVAVLWLSSVAAARAQELVLNEFLASNQNVIVDEDQQASDWIELYNAGAVEIDLSGYTLTDEADQPKQWPFPTIKLAPKHYLLVWASGKNRAAVDSLHTNFKLNAAGEFIGLYAPNGEAVDSLTFGAQTTDRSYGRLPDGDSSFTFFRVPTPGQANKYSPLQDAVVRFSQPEGLYANSVTVALETNAGNGEIRYTRNGNEPKKSSALYRAPLTLNQNTIVRARVFVADSAVSAIATATYLVNDDPRLPILSLVTAPANLWDAAIGIYTNYLREGRDWERPGHIALIEDGITKFSTPIGVRIHGGSSRETDKKNFRVYFRSDYGQSTLHYRLFPQKKVDRFETLVLYAPSGDQPTGDSKFTLIDDALSHSLWLEIDGLISAFRPVSLYLNGEYWGIYWLREHVNEDYVVSNFGITDMDLHRVTGETGDSPVPEVRAGDTVFWNETFSFFEKNRMTSSGNYELAKSKYVHLENFLDYNIINIYGGNWDWPHNNVDRFHDRLGEDTRWRWIMWDVGAAWNHIPPDHPTLEWATRDRVRTDIKEFDSEGRLWSTLMLRKLLENEAFHHLFLNRFADLMNTTLSGENIQEHITMLAEWIRPEMNREMARWGVQDLSQWDRNVQNVRSFVWQREGYQLQQLIDQFGLNGTAEVTVLPSNGKGEVTLNTITPASLPFQGAYFHEVPITLKATPAPGYVFRRWSGASQSTKPEITLTLHGNIQIQASFRETLQAHNVKVEARTDTSALVLWATNKPANAQVEYGLDTTALAFQTQTTAKRDTAHQVWLTGLQPNTRYYFRVKNREATGDSALAGPFAFTTLRNQRAPIISETSAKGITAARAYIVWQTDEPADGQVEYGLTAAFGQVTELVAERTLAHQHTLQNLLPDTLYHYRVRSRDVDGNLAVSAAQSFRTLEISTGVYESSSADASGVPKEFRLSPNYPNPFGNVTQLHLHLPSSGRLLAIIYNIYGQEVVRIHEGVIAAGYKILQWNGVAANGQQARNGVYLLRVQFEKANGGFETGAVRLILNR
ncbi:CotH kinase family protein [candidate division KSB1 bacterium]|nr:CotH kinase family protein [candidate division KSB1 bacterium]